MAFKLHKEAREWFAELSGNVPFTTLFDVYHACLVLGLAAERRDFDEGSLTEFMDDFIQRYKPYQTRIVGAFIATVVKRKGITKASPSEITNEIGRLLSGDTLRGDLKPEGFSEMNSYALGGFNLLRERIDVPPKSPAVFFEKYRELIQTPSTGIQI